MACRARSLRDGSADAGRKRNHVLDFKLDPDFFAQGMIVVARDHLQHHFDHWMR